MPLSLGIVALLVILVFSYRQTIKAYPSAGGAYIVTRDNFGVLPAQVAGVALLTDYILTVAVSVSAGVAAHVLGVPERRTRTASIDRGRADLDHRVHEPAGREGVGPDLRGPDVRLRHLHPRSWWSWAWPRRSSGGLDPVHVAPREVAAGAGGSLGIFLLLHAFAGGSTAMTGVEAISNGVPAFKPVEWRNARKVLAWLGVLLGMMFLGISFLAVEDHPMPSTKETVISQIDPRRRRQRRRWATSRSSSSRR